MFRPFGRLKKGKMLMGARYKERHRIGAYEVLQGLHDRGILAALKGALGASDLMLESAVAIVKTPEGIRTMGNLLLLARLLGRMEPELLDRFVGAIPEAINKGAAAQPNPPGLLSLAQRFSGNESRRGLAVAAGDPGVHWEEPRAANEAPAIEQIEIDDMKDKLPVGRGGLVIAACS